MTSATTALAAVLAVLRPLADVLDERVEDAEPPRWAMARGWAGFLAALDDATLARCEAEGLATVVAEIVGAPTTLQDLAAAVTDRTRLPTLTMDLRPPSAEALRSVASRKREQLAALLGAVGPMATHASRIVDVGAGSGHFTRIAADMFARAAVGIERDPARVAAAEARAAGAASFVALDALAAPLDLAEGDLAVGLHACGELGDRLAHAAAEAGCDLALVSCCLQKITAPSRAPLSRAAAGLALRREILGLANLTSQPLGVEVSIDRTLAAREARFALLRLLRARGCDLAPGEEMRGLNRRRARKGLADLAQGALALRGLAAATPAEVAHFEEDARRRYALVRRFSLPRSMLGRLVEVAVVLDRAALLEERGSRVMVATIVERAATPRNVGLFASRARERLPISS